MGLGTHVAEFAHSFYRQRRGGETGGLLWEWRAALLGTHASPHRAASKGAGPGGAGPEQLTAGLGQLCLKAGMGWREVGSCRVLETPEWRGEEAGRCFMSLASEFPGPAGWRRFLQGLGEGSQRQASWTCVGAVWPCVLPARIPELA